MWSINDGSYQVSLPGDSFVAPPRSEEAKGRIFFANNDVVALIETKRIIANTKRTIAFRLVPSGGWCVEKRVKHGGRDESAFFPPEFLPYESIKIHEPMETCSATQNQTKRNAPQWELNANRHLRFFRQPP